MQLVLHAPKINFFKSNNKDMRIWMQKQYPKNIEFFTRYFRVGKSLKNVIRFFHFISLATGAFVLYAFIYTKMPIFLVAFALACLFALGIEFFQSRSWPVIFRTIMQGKFTPFDFILGIPLLLITLGLVSASAYLSFNGSKDGVKVVSGSPTLLTFADSTYQTKKDSTFSFFAGERHQIEREYALGASAVERAYASRLSAKNKESRNYYSLWKSGNNWAKSRYQKARQERADLEAHRDTELAELSKSFSTELQKNRLRRTARIDSIENEQRQDQIRINAFNQSAQDEFNTQSNRYGGMLGWFAVFCCVGLAFAYFMQVAFEMGSKIETKTNPSKYFNSAWGALGKALSDWADIGVRRYALLAQRHVENKTKKLEFLSYKNSEKTVEKRPKIGFDYGSTSFETTDFNAKMWNDGINAIIREEKRKLHSYQWKIKNKKGKKETAETNIARIQQYINQLETQKR